jgi:hypothetical protein
LAYDRELRMSQEDDILMDRVGKIASNDDSVSKQNIVGSYKYYVLLILFIRSI